MLKKLFSTVLLCVVLATTAYGTHISGGEIYYNCLGGNQYRITLVVYRDCAGISLNGSYTLNVNSPCGNKTMTVTTPGGTEISQLCDLQLPNSTCNGGSLPGIQQFIYTGTVTLPPCNFWTISWTEQWRNGAIANLVQPGNKNVYIEAKLNNVIAPCDDSPQFTNTAIPYVCAGFPISYSYGAYDPTGDSLTYTFISAMNTGAVNLPYVGAFTGTEPITGITLDPHTGQVGFTLNQIGNWVVVVRVDQFDNNGNWIGSVMRDMQFIAYPCTNIPPDATTGTVTNLSGQAIQTGPRSIQICESGDFCFDAVITDANATNILTATSNITQNLPGATFSYSGINPITVHVCWTGVPNASGFFPFIITANDGACPIPALQTYVYSIHVLPGISYFGPTIVDESCAGNGDGSASVGINVGTAPFHYIWNTGDTTSSITAGAGDYHVTISDGNGCVNGPISATISTANQPSTVNAGPDLIGCEGELPVALTGTVTNAPGGIWSGGTGVITGTGLNATYMPSSAELASGGVDLYLTTTGDSPCGSAQDTVHITFSTSFSNAAIAATDLLCHGNSAGSATFTPNTAGFTYLWNDPAAQTTATATGLSAGSYSVLATDVYGCQTTMSVSITEPAALNLASLIVVDEQCAGVDLGSMSATVTGGTLPYQYTWSNGASTASIQATAGTYTVTVTDANGCASVQGTGTISADGQPNAAHAGADMITCFGDLPIQLNGTVTNATGGVWSGGNGTFSNTGLQPTYMPTPAELLANGVDLVLTTTGNTNCPVASDIIHITLPTSFFGSALSTSSLACNSDHSGSASFTPNNSSLTYLWSDASAQTTATANGLSAGTYSVHVTDSYGCDTTASVVITEPTALSAITITPTPPTCSGNGNGSASVQLSGGTPGYSYQWSANANGQATSTAFGLPAGAYTVVVTDANGCHAQATTTLTAPTPITLTAQVEDTVCVNTPVPLTAQASGGAGGYTITWTGIGTGDMLQYSFPASQVVQVSVVDQNGCSGPMLELPVTVLDLSLATLHTYGDTAFCPGGTATVGAWVTGYPGSTSLSWPQLPATGNGPFTLPATASRSLTVTATDGCSNTLQGMITITVETPPAVTLPAIIAEGCEPLTVHFPTGLTNQPVSYLWTFGDGTTSTSMSPVHVYHAGNFTVSLTVTTPLGCSAAALNTGAVHAFTNPVAAFTATPWEVDADHADIQFIDQSTGSISTWDWSFGDGGISIDPDPAYHYLEPGTWQVSLHVADDHGCTSSVDHIIKVNPVYDITIPNAFTPNPHGGSGGGFNPMDLSNDVFYPFIRFVKDFRMRVFNRWGELVFESNDIERGWDGYYKGHISQQDVYIYQVWVRFVDNKEVQRTGDITLFR